MSARANVAANQASVLRHLLAGDPPTGFDQFWFGLAHDALRVKRAWACSVSWPTIARPLGSATFSELFGRYADENPHQPVGGSAVDGRLFADALHRWGRLPDVACVQALAFDLRYRIDNGEKVRRRGVKVACRRISNPPHLLIGVGLPFAGGARVFRIRTSSRAMRA